MSCATALLAGCGDKTPSGNFCDIAKPDHYATVAVLDYMLENDKEHVKKDVAENEYGVTNCGWVKLPPKGE